MVAGPIVTIPSSQFVTRLSRDAQPVAAVDPGEVLRFETSDATYLTLTGESIDADTVDFREINRMTGPVFVRGAEAGDAVGFEIIDLEISHTAHVVYVSRWRSDGFGLEQSEVRHLTVSTDGVRIGDSITIPIRPMIGCIGAAPERGFLSALSPCRSTGGNLDIADFRPGTTVWIPVRVHGALVALGDLHASMGLGEPVGCGLECGGVVTGRFHLRKSAALPGVRFETETTIGFVGSHATDSTVAQNRAVNAAWRWLTIGCGISTAGAIAVCAGLLDITLGGPAGANCVASFDRRVLQASGIMLPDAAIA